MIEYVFFQNALAAVLIISVAAGIIGCYVVTRRLVSVAGGVTHACFGGLGLGYFLGVSPVLMAGVVAVASSLGVEWAARRRVRADSAVAVVWALGMAVGVVLVFLTPGYVPELNAFLFGNILTISRADLLAFAVYTILLVAFYCSAFKVITVCAFDADFARVRHLPYVMVTTAMTALVAVGIVLTIRLVGVMMLMSMLSLPALVAETFTRRMSLMVVVACGVSALCCVAGLFLAAVVNVPCSALIVLVLVVTFALARGVKAIFNRNSR